MSEITSRIDNLLAEKGLTRYKLEKDLGFVDGTIRRWARGSVPNSEYLVKVASYLDTSVEFLVTGATSIPSDVEKDLRDNYSMPVLFRDFMPVDDDIRELLNIYDDLRPEVKEFIKKTAKSLLKLQNIRQKEIDEMIIQLQKNEKARYERELEAYKKSMEEQKKDEESSEKPDNEPPDDSSNYSTL